MQKGSGDCDWSVRITCQHSINTESKHIFTCVRVPFYGVGNYCIIFIVFLTVYDMIRLFSARSMDPNNFKYHGTILHCFNPQKWGKLLNLNSSDVAGCAMPPTSSKAYVVLLIQIVVCLLSAVIFSICSVRCPPLNSRNNKYRLKTNAKK